MYALAVTHEERERVPVIDINPGVAGEVVGYEEGRGLLSDQINNRAEEFIIFGIGERGDAITQRVGLLVGLPRFSRLGWFLYRHPPGALYARSGSLNILLLLMIFFLFLIMILIMILAGGGATTIRQ